jgi:hypothetical protein
VIDVENSYRELDIDNVHGRCVSGAMELTPTAIARSALSSMEFRQAWLTLLRTSRMM